MATFVSWRDCARYLVVMILVSFVAGCGGDGGGTSASSAPAASTLSGVAAVGAPIVAGTVSVICATNSSVTSTATTSSTGAWQVTLAGQAPPCAVEVLGGTINVNGAVNTMSYHAIAVTAGTVNITPLTDLMVANMVGTSPSTWFAGLSSNKTWPTGITQAQVTTALANLRVALNGLTPLSNINPITTAFTPTSGNVGDDMLTALAAAMTNAGVTYASLLNNASNSSLTATPSGFSAALSAAYQGTTSGATGGSATYAIGGTVTGLTGSVVLQDNGGDNLTVSGNTAFTFPTKVATGSPYSVSVFTQPTGQTCTVSTGGGTVSGSNVGNVAVTCASGSYTVGGSVSGLSGSLVLQDNLGDNLTVAASGTFTFATKVANGSPYSVTVLTHPTSQSCSVTNGSGTSSFANINTVTIACATNTYTVGGTVNGLSGSVVLQNNGGDNDTVSTNGTFNFPKTVAYGSTYNITILTQPAGQTCTVTGGSGTATANVIGAAVSCNAVATLPVGYIGEGGLVWMPATSSTYTWPNANAYCTTATINGKTGWRLPTISELSNLSISGSYKGLWNPANDNLWSSTLFAGLPGVHYVAGLWAQDFSIYDFDTDGHPVTCVNAATLFGVPAGYVSQGGLTWMPPQWYGNPGTSDWTDANSYCTATTINGQTGWRLPTIAELRALCVSGAMVGQGWALGNTWSSTVANSGSYYVYELLSCPAVSSDMFNLSTNYNSNGELVTCVR